MIVWSPVLVHRNDVGIQSDTVKSVGCYSCHLHVQRIYDTDSSLLSFCIEPVGYEQEIPTRIPPPNRVQPVQGSAPRTKQPTHPHDEPSPSSSSDTNRWDGPRHQYDNQPEFKHVQRRMHGAPAIDAERKQKMHNRRSMPDLTKDPGFAAPVTRIMDDQHIPRGPGGGGSAPRGVGPPSPHHGQQRGPPPPHHGGPGGDQRRQGPAPDSLIQVSGPLATCICLALYRPVCSLQSKHE